MAAYVVLSLLTGARTGDRRVLDHVDLAGGRQPALYSGEMG